MQTFDQAIVQLNKEGLNDYEEAQANADSPRQLHLLIHGSSDVNIESRPVSKPVSPQIDSVAAETLPEIDL